MGIRPQDAAVHLEMNFEQMMMVVPVDRDIQEAEHIREKGGRNGDEGAQIRPMRGFELQHHDGDDDCDHTVAESFQPAFIQCTVSSPALSLWRLLFLRSHAEIERALVEEMAQVAHLLL